MSSPKNELRVILAVLFLLFGAVLTSEAGVLTQEQMERVRAAKELLGAVDPRPVAETVAELRKARNSEGNLQILEAVAKSYREMLTEYPQNTQAKKEWLHSMVLLNMAYFQFGGTGQKNDSGLNITIRNKLRKYLSPELLADRSLFYSLE